VPFEISQRRKKRIIIPKKKRVPLDDRWLWRSHFLRHHARGASITFLLKHPALITPRPRTHAQIFFPRSIESEIIAHESGIRSIFGSRHQLTFVSQEQELFGTYDAEDPQSPPDTKPASRASLLLVHSKVVVPVLPSRALSPPLSQPPSYPQQQQEMAEPPLRLVPNRRAPSPPLETRAERTQRVLVDRFNNPATARVGVSRLKPNFRSPIGKLV